MVGLAPGILPATPTFINAGLSTDQLWHNGFAVSSAGGGVVTLGSAIAFREFNSPATDIRWWTVQRRLP